MDKPKRVIRLMAFAAAMCLSFPTSALPLEHNPNAPSVIVLEGHSDPPIQSHLVAATAKRSVGRQLFMVGYFGSTFVLTWGPSGLSLCFY
jgi:hypothetical protein